jgi:hypothetical protein
MLLISLASVLAPFVLKYGGYNLAISFLAGFVDLGCFFCSFDPKMWLILLNNLQCNIFFLFPFSFHSVCHVMCGFFFNSQKSLFYFNIYGSVLVVLQRIGSFLIIKEDIVLKVDQLNFDLTYISNTVLCCYYIFHLKSRQILIVIRLI